MKYHFKIYEEEVGYSAHGIELEGCITQGDTIEELYSNMQDALNIYIDEPADSAYLAVLPDKSIQLSKDVVEVSLDPQIASAFLERYERIKRSGISQ